MTVPRTSGWPSGMDSMKTRPLAGIRVLDVSAYISGPYAASLLASLGAEVIKLEPPEGEAFRIGKGTGNPFFAQYNAGKKSIAVDLKAREGIEIVKAMLPGIDVLIENMRPGKMASLGLGPEDCQSINPRLVYASVSGFGNGGPWVDRPAYDSIGQALGGFYTLMNDPDDVRLTGTCLADLISSVNVAFGVVATLLGRERDSSGRGARVETSVFEAVSTLTIDAMTQALTANIDPQRDTRHPLAQNFCLRTASHDYIVLHLSSSQKFWQSLMRAVGREEVASDPLFLAYADRATPGRLAMIKALLEEEFLKLPREEWERRLIEADVPFAPALTMREVAAHPQMKWLGILGAVAGGRTVIDPPWRFDGKRPRRTAHVPEIGEHSREVLSEFLEPAVLEDLQARGIVGTRSVAT